MATNSRIDSKVVVRSFGWKVLERFCSQGINLLVQILLARILLPDDFGKLAIIMAITNYAGLFVQSGLGVAIVQKKDLDEKDVNTLLTSSLLLASVFYAIIFVFSSSFATYYQHPDLKWPLRVLSIVLFLNGINSIQTALFSRDMRFKHIFIRSVTAVPLAAFISLLMAYKGYGIWALVVYTLLNTGLTVFIMALASDYKLKIEFYWSRAKVLYSFSIKILFAALVSGFGDTLRTLLIGKKYTSSDLGYYDKGYTYSFYFTQIINASVSSVLLPTFSRSQDDYSELLSRARKSVQLTSYIIIPALITIVIIAQPLIVTLLTEKWLPSVFFLQIFCILRLPGCIVNIDRQVYLSIGNSSINLKYEAILLVANVIMLLVTLPLGVRAIAIGFLVTEILGCISLFIVSSKIYGYKLEMRIQDMWKPILSSIIVYFVCSMAFFRMEIPLLEISVKMIVALLVFLLMSVLLRDNNVHEIKKIIYNQIKK